MIPEPQLKVVQTPYGRTVVKIIPAPNVINLRKRGSLIATRWLASSPYAKYQEIADEMNREYLRKLAEYSQQLKKWKMEMEDYTATQIKQLQQKYEDMLKEQIKSYATTYSDLLYMKLVNSGLSAEKAKEVVLDFLTRSYVPFSRATDIVVNLEKKYAPKITPQPTPTVSSGGGGGSSRRRRSSGGSRRRRSSYSGSTSIADINKAAESASNTSYKEVPTTKPNVTAVVDESGKISCYHDYNRGISIPVTIPTTPSTAFSSLQRDIQRQRMLPWKETVYMVNYNFG